jgi:hypothetical protein
MSERTQIDVYRDDGPLARALGTLGRRVPVPATALVAVGVAGLLLALILGGSDAADWVPGVAVLWLVLTAGLASGRPHGDRLLWTIPSLLRVGEYAGVLWMADVAGDSSLPAAFALLCVVAFRQYDLVYRLRYAGMLPPAWVDAVTLGWDGRLVLVWVLLALGALPAGLYVAAGLLAIVLVGDTIAGWRRFNRASRLGSYDDEEDEAA